MPQEKLANHSEAGPNSGPTQEPHEPSATPSSTYEACMQVYRWMSRRYRKTLDALAK